MSDRSARGERPDLSGPALEHRISSFSWIIVKKVILPDDLTALSETLAAWADSGEMDLILTTGGTGFSMRDITPEATRGIIEREAPGLAEAMRTASMHSNPHAMLSRAVCGIRRQALIVNLPGSPKAAVENFEIIQPVIPHAIQLLRQDPNAEAGHEKFAKK